MAQQQWQSCRKGWARRAEKAGGHTQDLQDTRRKEGEEEEGRERERNEKDTTENVKVCWGLGEGSSVIRIFFIALCDASFPLKKVEPSVVGEGSTAEETLSKRAF